MDPAAALRSARADEQRGRDLVAVGKPGEAQRILSRALSTVAAFADDAPGLADLRCRVYITRAFADFELYGPERAEATLAAAAELADRYGLDGVRVRLHNQRGVLALRSGRFRDAIGEFDRALAAAPADAVYEQSLVLLHRGVAYFEVGDMRNAGRDLRRCERVAGDAGLSLVAAKAVHNLAFVEFVAGDLPAALAAFERSQARHPGAVHAGRSAQARAEVLIEAGLLVEAQDALADAARAFRADRLPVDVALVELDAARCALALGDTVRARTFARSADRRFRRREAAGWARAAALVALQADVRAGRARPHTVEQAIELADLWEGDGLRLQARMARLVAGEAALDADAADRAADLYLAAGRPRADDPITGRTYFHLVGARLAAASGRSGLARQRAARGLAELARYQASFGSLDLRTASAVHGRRLAELDITLALGTGRPAAVFAAAERARAVASRLPPVRPPDDPVAADLLAELRQTLETLREAEQDPIAAAPLLRRRRELERDIVARTWTRAGSGGGSALRAARLDEVRAALAAHDCTLVTYVHADAQLWAVVTGAATLRLVRLGESAPVLERVRRVRADLDVLAQSRLPAPLRTAVRGSLDRSLGGLDDALVRPLRLGGGPLAVVSTGLLGQLPWASLPSLRGISVVVAPSATKWLASSASAAASVERTEVVALAGPDLVRGNDEAKVVGERWARGRMVSGAAADRGAFLAAMESARLLHVAAHGTHQPENPLFSCLRLADGAVFAHELDQTAAAPEHVILSACEVGIATVRPGDEPLGLASVLLQLGTRSVIAGVARVADDVAEQTMAVYHERLVSGSDSAEALAAALIEVDADVVPPFVAFGAAWSA